MIPLTDPAHSSDPTGDTIYPAGASADGARSETPAGIEGSVASFRRQMMLQRSRLTPDC